jgi:hypothetical protein
MNPHDSESYTATAPSQVGRLRRGVGGSGVAVTIVCGCTRATESPALQTFPTTGTSRLKCQSHTDCRVRIGDKKSPAIGTVDVAQPSQRPGRDTKRCMQPATTGKYFSAYCPPPLRFFSHPNASSICFTMTSMMS